MMAYTPPDPSVKRVFVSGCYDILHAGHVQFFREARALGDHLTVCFASNEVTLSDLKCDFQYPISTIAR